ncbi:MAG: hypothetical protein GY862_27555 [Gammaproteobacteria bacterium]|nr:hypothetical protein [Gammaproteobacteria bacterium]
MPATTANIQPPPRRPTLLVGYGAFGMDVLRRLLSNTVLRGILSWKDTRSKISSSERHIQDLAFLWIRDRFSQDGQYMEEELAHEGGSLEMMRDLYRQIHEVEQKKSPEQDLAEAMVKAAENLLSASARTVSNDALPLGLDVVVIIHPSGPEVVGHLDRMLIAAIDKLANNANLQRAVQGASPLNFIQILDFENYWDNSGNGPKLRQTVYNSVKSWQKRREQEKRAFERFYFVDGRTRYAMRDKRHRVEEISLFLEFLLFEGQRVGPFQSLYQSHGAHESPIAGFGIRLVERNSGLFSRLAAASFGIAWLDYLAGNEVSGFNTEPRALREKLAPYRLPALEEELGRLELHALLEERFRSLEQQFMESLDVDEREWPQYVRVNYEQTVRQLETDLTAQVHARLKDITEKRLMKLSGELRAGIQTDLHESREPTPLGRITQEIDSALSELDTSQIDPGNTISPVNETEKVLKSVEGLHSRYLSFKEQRLNPEGFKQWWICFSLILASGLTPVIVELLDGVPPPDKTQQLLTMGYEWLLLANNPVAVSLLLFSALWALGFFIFHKRIQVRVERTREFWIGVKKGRFTDYIRGALQSGGILRRPSEEFLENTLSDMALSVRTEVRRELGRVVAYLHNRRQEIMWLREQLREFLKMHRQTAAVQNEGRHDQEDTDVRHAVERIEDFEARLQGNPPTPDRFRATQAELKPFTGWDSRYSETFLYPIKFIETLSSVYADPFAEELTRPGTGIEQDALASEFVRFLKEKGPSFCLSFLWKAGEGVQPEQKYCLLPDAWRSLPGVQPGLSDMGVSGTNMFKSEDDSRAYMLRIQTGVDPERLIDM